MALCRIGTYLKKYYSFCPSGTYGLEQWPLAVSCLSSTSTLAQYVFFFGNSSSYSHYESLRRTCIQGFLMAQWTFSEINEVLVWSRQERS
jgi:hypothetical protein